MANLSFEIKLQTTQNIHLIAGLDEAGRGALAGPVVAGAVILPLHHPEKLAILAQVNDSKQLTAKQRDRFYELVTQYALAYGVGSVSAAEIDRHGIIAATKQAMRLALDQLEPQPEYLFIDGRIRLTTIPLPQQAIIRGDSLSLSIAAASILAKVSRDRHMIALAADYPHYGFEKHKGYGTAQHTAAITAHGPTAVHRHTFAPIRNTLL